MKSKETITIPKIMENKIIECLTDDNMLNSIANIIREFLHITWLIDPNAAYFTGLKKQNLIDPLNQLLTSTLNLSKENLQKLCEDMIKPFLDSEFAEILIGKMMLEGVGSLEQKMNILEDNYKFGTFFMKLSNNTESALTNLKPPLSKKHYDKTLIEISNKRRARIKDYYHFELDDKTLRIAKSHRQLTSPAGIFLSIALLLSFFAFFIFKYELSGINTGLIFLASLTASILSFRRFSQYGIYHDNYLMNQVIIKKLLENIHSIFSPENNPAPAPHSFKSNKISITPKLKYATSEPIQENSYHQNDISTESSLKPNDNEIIQQTERKPKKEFQQDKISQKIEEIDKRLLNHKDNNGNINPEIIWKYEVNNKLIEKIYHPLRDMFKIIELWTLNPGKQILNHQHYMIWNEENIRNLLGKKNQQLYPDISRIGKIGRIAHCENEQGYVQCENYEEHPWKIKSLSRESGAYRMFFTPVSITKRESDSKEVTLYEAIEFRKTH